MLVGILIGSVGILIGSVGILIGSVGILIHWYFEHWYFERWYIRKVYSEAEKNNPMGSNTQCAGVIPDMDMQGSGFNPFSYFKTYNSLLPTEPHSKYQKYFLFPMGRVSGKAKN